MIRRVSAARAKAQLSELVARVAHGGEQVVIERRGKPLAALVSVDDLERLRREGATAPRPMGALALVGAWREIEDEWLNSFMEEVYSERERDTGRPVRLEE